MNAHSWRIIVSLLLIALFGISPVFASDSSVILSRSYGDTNVEQFTSVIGRDFVQAYNKVTISQPTVITSVSIYLQFSGSDGSQCLKFGIYRDSGSGPGSSPADQPLVAATTNGYCLMGTSNWGPSWWSWNLTPSDYLTILTPGVYWFCILAMYHYGTIYRYGQPSGFNYTYGYADYFFPADYSNGFPSTFSSNPTWEAQAPYSFYMTGIPALA